ncbi:MAG: type II 3-dehydroquinate dehydratase [Muribaculaceae bacterium]|nr:type II 3-dehydroquinate dehydratase [Muribaculaceae bacterium]
MKIAIINGPNLNRLGERNPEIYGPETLDDTIENLRKEFSQLEIYHSQSNCEGEIINIIQKVNDEPGYLGIVINPGAYAHYSYAIADAITDSKLPVIEVHISNIHAREEFRAKSVTGACAKAVICGCGRKGYKLAIDYLLDSNL